MPKDNIITLTLKEIRDSVATLNEIGKKEGLDFKFNYRIARLVSDLEPIYKDYEKSLSKFFKENGKYNKETGSYGLNPKDEKLVTKFEKTNNSLLNEKTEISFSKIPLKMFEEYDIPAGHIKNIFWVIDGEL